MPKLLIAFNGRTNAYTKILIAKESNAREKTAMKSSAKIPMPLKRHYLQ